MTVFRAVLFAALLSGSLRGLVEENHIVGVSGSFRRVTACKVREDQASGVVGLEVGGVEAGIYSRRRSSFVSGFRRFRVGLL